MGISNIAVVQFVLLILVVVESNGLPAAVEKTGESLFVLLFDMTVSSHFLHFYLVTLILRFECQCGIF